MTKVDQGKAKKALESRAKKVTDKDVEKVLKRQAEIEERFSSGGPLGRFVADVKILFSMIQDYVKGDYRAVPWWTVAAIVAALLYVLNPLDLIPDQIPMVGQLDDAFVVAVCLKMVEQDLQNYVKWK
jgi:uncharacterized membrane protein YkvA (DUF1232 family)